MLPHDTVFHTYSTYARGAEMTGGSNDFLDLTALGRQEVPERRANGAEYNFAPIRGPGIDELPGMSALRGARAAALFDRGRGDRRADLVREAPPMSSPDRA